MAKNRPWLEAEEIELRALYAAEASLDEIAAKLGRTYEAVNKRARALGLWKRHRNAEIQRRYFESITTSQQAYFLGLLAADGSISNVRARYSVCLALKRSDVELVIRFRDTIAPSALLDYD